MQKIRHKLFLYVKYGIDWGKMLLSMHEQRASSKEYKPNFNEKFKGCRNCVWTGREFS